MEKLNIHNKCILASLEANELELLYPYSDRLRVIVILEGSGKVTLDTVSSSYQKDSIFILRAQQNISFQTFVKTKIFTIISGSSPKSALKDKPYITTFSTMFGQIESLVSNKSFVQGKVMERSIDRESANQIIKLITHEMQNRPDSNKEIIRNGVFTFIHILDRNIQYVRKHIPVLQFHPETDQILEYIKRQLQLNNKFDIQEIASSFKVSEDCISEILIARTGFTFKKFIVKYRTDLFKSKLLKWV
ncbi:hypothetical protein [Dyadobacter sp. 3J3]|uniref:hypothetical protein n=1 Tax=Dyadobacter sp. 3J3 TaxID=2606600 RepID=UPI00135CCA34|nr:hypothetical protein [Dyadobacter sp. 3J3]